MVVPELPWIGAVALMSVLVHAQFPPTPQGVTVVKSQFEEGVSISYKEACHSSAMSLDFTILLYI